MKKTLALVLSLLMLMTAAAIPAAAVDNYTPKTVYLVANADGTCSLPDGCCTPAPESADAAIVGRMRLFFIVSSM